jgi:hypothetical protein
MKEIHLTRILFANKKAQSIGLYFIAWQRPGSPFLFYGKVTHDVSIGLFEEGSDPPDQSSSTP